MGSKVAVSSVRCIARSHKTGVQCRRLSIRGAEVCWTHGGAAPQVRVAAAARVTLAEAMALGDRRPAWEIFADALHSADILMLDARVKLEAGVTVEQLNRFAEALERAQRFAKMFLDAGVDERQTRIAEAQAVMLVGVIRAVLDDLDLTAEQRAKVGEVVPRHMRAVTAA